ncbi:MAG TPA: PEP-CTERM sorting domain-containing protein [Myxococcota bacterium]
MSEQIGRNHRAGAITGCLAALVILLGASFASAATIETLLTPFAGGDVVARIVLDDAAAMPGEIEVTVEITEGLSDIRGVYFELALDDALLSGLTAYGSPYVTSYAYGDVINLGFGSNLHGGGTPCPCDFGVEIGTPGAGKDGIQALSFILAHESLALDLSLFYEQSVGLRATGFGKSGGLDVDGQGGAAAKLHGVMPIPEPSTGLLLGLGLCAMALRARRSA